MFVRLTVCLYVFLLLSSYLNHEQFRQISAVLLTAAQLGLQSVTIPLAYLAFAIGLIALGAAITGLVAGVFYILASALGKSTQCVFNHAGIGSG